MIIHVKVKPNSEQQKIESFGGDRYLVYVKSPPENDKANIELINLLAKHFGTPPGRFHIKFGRTSDKKIIEVR